MSHYSGHLRPNNKIPLIRYGFLGGAIVAVSYIGFWSYLTRRDLRKHINEDGIIKVSGWESKVTKSHNPIDGDPALVRTTAAYEQRKEPLEHPKTEHNHKHYTRSEAAAMDSGEAGKFESPYPQRDGGHNGRVYTKAPDWDHKVVPKQEGTSVVKGA